MPQPQSTSEIHWAPNIQTLHRSKGRIKLNQRTNSIAIKHHLNHKELGIDAYNGYTPKSQANQTYPDMHRKSQKDPYEQMTISKIKKIKKKNIFDETTDGIMSI